MHLTAPAALLASLAATPLSAAPAQRQNGRSFSELLSQKQTAPPPAVKAPEPPRPPSAAARAPAKEPSPASAESPRPAGSEAAPQTQPSSAEAGKTPASDAAPGNPEQDAGETASSAETSPASDPNGAGDEAHPGVDKRRLKGGPVGLEAGRMAAASKAGGPAAAASELAEEAGVPNTAPEDATRAAGDAPAGLDPALAHFVAELRLDARAESTATGEASLAAESKAGTAAAAGSALPRAPETDALSAAHDQEAARADSQAGPLQAALMATAGRQHEQRQREVLETNAARIGEVIGTRQEAGRESPPMPTGLFTVPAGGLVGAASASASAAAAAAPHGVPDFAHTLGAQISVLAREGVQRARLNVHGGDMGAVSVQIVMDGTQAQVHFGADAAATRDAIQAGLPDLASALREAGLTLSGGDVSSRHSRGGAEDARSEGGSRAGGAQRATEADRAAESAQSVPLRRFGSAAGGIDLYA